MQLDMNLSAPINTKNLWAFAVDINRQQSVFKKPRKNINREKARGLSACVISAVSREARAYGVRAGMRYTEAKKLIPELRILICNR